MDQWLCALDAIPLSGARGFDLEPIHGLPHRVFALRVQNQKAKPTEARKLSVRVYEDCCPHQHLPLPWRTDAYLSADERHIVCSAHGALFDPDSGVCVAGPCQGQSLMSYQVHIDAQDQVFLRRQ